uniref:Uncharacterized protein n=1 Tax=Anguilla anguilla TaxID=7936 RepID=A0A0E9U0R9_ANGAN
MQSVVVLSYKRGGIKLSIHYKQDSMLA